MISDVILAVVNLDPNYTHAGWTGLNLEALGVEPLKAIPGA